MLLPTTMVAVRFYIHKDNLDAFLYELGELKCVHFVDIRKTAIKNVQYVESGEVLFRITSLTSRLNSLISSLKIKVKKIAKRPSIENLEAVLDKAEKEVEQVGDEVIRIQSKIAELKRRGGDRDHIKRLEEELGRIAKEKGDSFNFFLEILTKVKAVEEAKGLMARTKSTYVFEGWIPEKRLKEVLNCVRRHKGYLIVTSKEKEEAPTVVKNPTILKTFEALVKTYGLPSYGEIDPTLFFAISFPIIFGMMFGDIGHGFLILILGLLFCWMRRRIGEPTGFFQYFLKAGPLMVVCAPSSILFGFLYGEFFGSPEWFTVLTGLRKPLWFSPLKSPMTLLKYAIIVGIIQISFGLILDFTDKLLNKRFRDAIASPLLWIWLYWSGGYLVFMYGWGVFRVLFDPMIIGPFILLPFAVMTITRAVLYGMEGVTQSIESLMSSFSHTISYLRILALNMIHGIFSKMFLPTDLLGFIPFIFGTLFVIVGFEQTLVFLHTLRLHWVEWFTKFYHGAGVEYRPFIVK